ncbi:MAG: KpsF/GutQ family sugar-phosphate isomerase [Pseudomonadota bacterium]
MSAHRLTELADAVLETEARAITALRRRLDDDFVRACSLLLACTGRVVVTGMGKSGHIGRKLAATLASTGTAAFYVHPGEATHGDLGMIREHDVVVALSNSGETPELLALLPWLLRHGIGLIALTGQPRSSLARAASAHLDVSVEQEACPLGLAPTASTTATLAMGDALAIALLDSRGFTAEDFARSHPAGALGRKLLMRVSDVMVSGTDIPTVKPETRLTDMLVVMSSKGLGMTVVSDDGVNIEGVFTDGDLRRTLDGDTDVKQATAREVMTRDGKRIEDTELAAVALQTMQAHSITALPVVNVDGALRGVVHLNALLRAGVA